MEWKENMTKEEYTKAIEEAREGLFSQEKLQSECDKIRTKYSKKIKELENKIPKKKTEQEIKLEKRENTVKQKEIQYKIMDTFTANGIPNTLAKYVKINDNDNIDNIGTEIKDILQKQYLQSGYKPDDHKGTDKYSQFEKEQNVEGMIGSKFRKMFK